MSKFKKLELSTAIKGGAYDLHTRSAARLFGVECKDVTPRLRELAKSYNYGRHYKMSAPDVIKMLSRGGL